MTDEELKIFKTVSIYIGSAVALFSFFCGQVLIPWTKYRHQQAKGRAMLLAMMKASAAKTVDFFGENSKTAFCDKIIYRINEQIENVLRDDKHEVYVTVSEDHAVSNEIMGHEFFWFLEPELIEAYTNFDENAKRAAALCNGIMSQKFQESVVPNRQRYSDALTLLRSQLEEWLHSANELKRILQEVS